MPKSRTVRITGGNHQFPGIVEDFVDLLFEEVVPDVATKTMLVVIVKGHDGIAQVGLVDRGFPPGGQGRSGLAWMPDHVVQTLVQIGKEIPPFAVRNEATEKLVVRLPIPSGHRVAAQLAGQFVKKCHRRRVFLERVVGVMGYIADNPPSDGCRHAKVGGNQQDADQARVHHLQVVEAHRGAIEHHLLAPLDQAIDHPTGLGAHVPVQPRQLEGGLESAFVTVGDAHPHQAMGNGVG